MKSANLFYIIFSKIIERLKYGMCEYFIDKFVTRYNQIINLRKKASVVKTMIIPVKQKFIKKKKTKRFSVFENKFVIPKLFDEYHRNSVDNKYKLKIRPVYLFNKRFNDEYKTFNNFFQEWNSNKDKQMIKYIYKYTQQNFSTNHHMLYSQISKLIKTNKLDTLEKEVNKNKNDTTRLNTVSRSTKLWYRCHVMLKQVPPPIQVSMSFWSLSSRLRAAEALPVASRRIIFVRFSYVTFERLLHRSRIFCQVTGSILQR